MNVFRLNLLVLFFISFGCSGSDNGAVLPVSHGFTGVGASILEVTLLEDVPQASYEGEWDIGSGYVIRVPAIDTKEVSSIVRIPIPLGIMKPTDGGIKTGVANVRIIRTQNGNLSTSSHSQSFFISQFTGGFVEPPGSVALAATNAIQTLAVHGVGDIWLVDEFALGQLDFNAALIAATRDVEGFRTLSDLVERVMGGEVFVLGFKGETPIVIDTESLPIMDRLVATMNGALAKELGSLPPHPTSFPDFYVAIAHDFEDDAADSVRVSGGAAQFGFLLYEQALSANGSSVAELDSAALGAIAWFNAFATGFASLNMLDGLPAHAGTSQGSFGIVKHSADQTIPYIYNVARFHFGVESKFPQHYGLEVWSAGNNFIVGLISKKDIIASIQAGLANGLIPTNGLPSPEFEISAEVDPGLGEYKINISTNPPSPDETIAIRIVGSDMFIGGEDLVTDASGNAVSGTFQNHGFGSFDIVHGVNPAAGGPDSQSGTLIIFP